MKSHLQSFTILLLVSSFYSFAQDSVHSSKPVVTLGKMVPLYNNPKGSLTETTRKEILANGKLVTRSGGCVVTGYTFSMLPYDHDFVGPYKITGSELTPEIKNIVKELSGKILIENIMVSCGDRAYSTNNILLKYDH